MTYHRKASDGEEDESSPKNPTHRIYKRTGRQDKDTVYLDYLSDFEIVFAEAKNGTPPYSYQWREWVSDCPDKPYYFNYGHYENTDCTKSYIEAYSFSGHTRFDCVVTDKAGDTVFTKPVTVYYVGNPVIVIQPQSLKGNDYYDTVYLECKAIPSLVYDQTVLEYQWQCYDHGWENCAPAVRGQNSPGFTSKLEIMGKMYGKLYRCIVTDTRTGQQEESYMVKPTIPLRIVYYRQVGTKQQLEATIEGGEPPYCVWAEGYYYTRTTYRYKFGSIVETIPEKGFGFFYRNCSEYRKNGDGSVTVLIKNADRYEKCVGDCDITPFSSWTKTYKAQYKWHIYVKDSSGKIIGTDYPVEMEW